MTEADEENEVAAVAAVAAVLIGATALLVSLSTFAVTSPSLSLSPSTLAATIAWRLAATTGI